MYIDVYLDKLFLSNLAVDFFILWVVSRLGGVRVGSWRLLAASCLGGLYSLGMFVPEAAWLYSPWAKMAFSMLLALSAFFPLPPARFVTCLGFLYLVSFVMGGMAIGCSYLLSSAGIAHNGRDFPAVISAHLWQVLPAAGLGVYTASCCLPRYLKSRVRTEAARLPVTIFLGENSIEVQGLVDTGNNLSDPVSGEPVLVVEHSAMKEVLPEKMQDERMFLCDAAGAFQEMAGTPMSCRMRLIPFRSLGNECGLLVGIRPDRVEFVKDMRLNKVEKVVIGIHGSRLDAGSRYNALINPSMLDRAVTA